MQGTIELTRTGTVGVLLIDLVHRNALDPEVVTTIEHLVAEAEGDPAITALVIASGGGSYCSGANLELLRRVAADPVEEHAYASLGAIYAMFEAIQACAIPTLAAVNGAIVGAGVNLALACDLRIVSDDVMIAGFGKAGVHAGGGHLSLLAQRVGEPGASALALFGQTLDAAAAVQCGFAIEQVPVAQLRERAVEIAAAAGPDKALVMATVRSFRAASSLRLTPAAAVQLERAPQVWSLRRRFATA